MAAKDIRKKLASRTDMNIMAIVAVFPVANLSVKWRVGSLFRTKQVLSEVAPSCSDIAELQERPYQLERTMQHMHHMARMHILIHALSIPSSSSPGAMSLYVAAATGAWKGNL
jgi:hypothetical protein